MLKLQIAVLSQLYALIAEKINNWENHRTDSDYECSLVSWFIVFHAISCVFMYIVDRRGLTNIAPLFHPPLRAVQHIFFNFTFCLNILSILYFRWQMWFHLFLILYCLLFTVYCFRPQRHLYFNLLMHFPRFFSSLSLHNGCKLLKIQHQVFVANALIIHALLL